MVQIDFNELLTHRWLDLLVLLFLVWRGYLGLRNGFLLEVARIVGLIAGLVIASQVSERGASFLIDTFNVPENAAYVVAFVLILIAVVVIAGLVGRLSTRLASLVFLGWANRLGGLALSLVTGLLIVQAVILVIVAVHWQGILDAGPTTVSSFSRAPSLVAMLPPDLHRFIDEYIELEVRMP